MSFVKLKIPVLVQNRRDDGKQDYALKPVFQLFPVVVNRRFEQALSLFRKEIKKSLSSFHFSRVTADFLLWMQFNPDLEHHLISFEATGRTPLKGHISVISFELKGQSFLCFPSFRSFMAIANKDAKGRVNIQKESYRIIAELLRRYREEFPEAHIANIIFATKGEFITTVQMNAYINNSGFSFEKGPEDWFFSKMNNAQQFNGAIEIERVGYDMNSLFPSELKRSYFREEIVERMEHLVYQKENTPVVLIGRDGVGKHTVLHEVVYRHLQTLDLNTDKFIEKIWHIDPTRVIAGMSIVGWWQKRFESILQHILQRGKNSVIKSDLTDKLLVDNPVALLRIGKSAQSNMTLSDVLIPYLEKRQLQLIILATNEEWKLVQEKSRRFADLFQVHRLQEPELKTAMGMVLQQRRYLELQHECEITISAIDKLFSIHRNYLRNKALPGSIMRLMNQLAVKYKYQQIDSPQVRQEFEAISGFNEQVFDSTQKYAEDEVRSFMRANLVGQEEAVDKLSSLVHQIKARLNNPLRPLGSFLFIGPTGVGKTQAAKVLCQYLMGDTKKLMRFDMNEYIDAYAVQRLVGDYNNPEGQLTSKVRYQPFGVLLLDEIEKAHPKVHDILLQVLDDGRLTDSLGRTVDFTNTIIIMTSNIGARKVSAQLGFDTRSKDDSAVYRKSVENFFRPEFINRVGNIVIFNNLQLEHILNIARLQIRELLSRDGFVRRTTILNISTQALEWVAHRGFDAKMGGRALKRQIERDLTTLSAEQLINKQGDQPILFDIYLQKDRLVPEITPLEFVEAGESDWLPKLPDEAKGRSFYMKLIKRVERVEAAVRRMEESQEQSRDEVIIIGNEKGENLDWQYYDFKEKIASVKQKITNLSLGFRDKYFKEGPAIPLRLKGNNFIQRSGRKEKVIRQSVKDRLFQQEAIREISDIYRITTAQFNSIESEFIDSYLDVSFLELFSKGFLMGKTDRVSLQFKSYVEGFGEDEIETLIKIYSSIFEALEINFKVAKNRQSIEAESHSLMDLLKGEEGIHLFYLSHRNPLPILLQLKDLNATRKRRNSKKVTRIYDGSKTLTDLRTGYTNAINITPSEFKLLLFASAFPKKKRSRARES